MARSLSAFISYRRDDSFMNAAGPDSTSFLEKLHQALKLAGFSDVFIDVDGLELGDVFDSRLYKEIDTRDLFVALVGRNWGELLRQRKERSEPDILVHEVRAAIKRDKEILPVFVDGATMPPPRDFPPDIVGIRNRQAVSIRSGDSVESIARLLVPVFKKVARDRRRRSAWRTAYVTFALLAYFLCAINPHISGFSEYGNDPWTGMAKVWSAFFIWPMLFLPFALVALYRPLSIIFEFATNSKHLSDIVTYATPLVMALVVTALAVVIEIFGQYETPWTINPQLPKPGCASGPATAREPYAALAGYDSHGTLARDFEDAFWLQDKCWPNVFFYLTVPAYRPVGDVNYGNDRPAIERALVSVLDRKSGAPHSRTFWAYVISFSIQIWLGVTGIILAIFYVTVEIRRPQDDSPLQIASEDAYLCLTYSFVTLMVWVPFRMNTLFFKNLYFCEHLEKCPMTADHYLNDIILGTMLLIGYVYLTAGLVVKHRRRWARSILGGFAVAVIIMCAVAVMMFSDTIARMAEQWQFYVGISIPIMAILTGLWFMFNPAYVHRDDFRTDAA